jgi:hypothetical protein
MNSKMNRRSGRLPRTNIAEKLRFLARDRRAQKINGCTGINDLARKSGIKEATLKTALREELISQDHEEAVAKYCGFEVTWPEWRTGIADDFKQRYLHDAPQSLGTPVRGRHTDIPLRPRYDPPEVGEHRLAALSMLPELSNSSERWPIKFRLRCRVVDGYGIKRGYIDLNCYQAVAREDECSFAPPGTTLDGTNLSICAGAGTRRMPSWYIEANSGVLNGDYPEHEFCVVRELAPGDKLTASLSIYVKDVPSANDYICQQDGKALGRCKKAILDRIAALAYSHNGSGQIVLCTHEVIFEDACDGRLLAKATNLSKQAAK